MEVMHRFWKIGMFIESAATHMPMKTLKKASILSRPNLSSQTLLSSEFVSIVKLPHSLVGLRHHAY